MVLGIFSLAPHIASADDQVRVYPLQALFVADKALENAQFRKALSSDLRGTDRTYATGQFMTTFKRYFPETATTINDANKYSTFAVFLQIPRASQYKIVKSATLADLYLPMTMTISFANMGTGEILYTYTYTYYAKREATVASLGDEQITTALYREIYDLLLDKVISSARQNFHPFLVTAAIAKEWHGLFVLDKGDKYGIVKGDTLLGPQGLPMTVVYASGDYAIAQPIMGAPKTGMLFSKFTNGNLDEFKKPKVMLMPGTAVDGETHMPEQTIYQLFSNALGKNAAFTLTPVDKGFYDAQKTVIQETGLSQSVTQQRQLPEYFLRLQFMGPVSLTLPSNKGDVRYDEHTVRACGDLLDISGRVLYGTCVFEKITDEVVAGIRFAKEDRQEVVTKNAIVKLADQFIAAVKFKRFELPIKSVQGDSVTIVDKAGLLSIAGNAEVFRVVGAMADRDGSIQVPTWQLGITARKGEVVEAQVLGALTPTIPQLATSDTVLIEGMLSDSAKQLKRLSVCPQVSDGASQDQMSKNVYYALVQGLEYPFYDTVNFTKALQLVRSAAYGFKTAVTMQQSIAETELCVEPIIKVALDSRDDHAGYSQLAYGVLAGLKLHNKSGVIWKKGLRQTLKIVRPSDAPNEYVEQELASSVSLLFDTLAKSVKLDAM
jgi:hypothetical protein